MLELRNEPKASEPISCGRTNSSWGPAVPNESWCFILKKHCSAFVEELLKNTQQQDFSCGCTFRVKQYVQPYFQEHSECCILETMFKGITFHREGLFWHPLTTFEATSKSVQECFTSHGMLLFNKQLVSSFFFLKLDVSHGMLLFNKQPVSSFFFKTWGFQITKDWTWKCWTKYFAKTWRPHAGVKI